MSTSNQKYKVISERLKPLVLTNNMSEINDVFEEFTIESILNKQYINYCRYRNEVSLVIFTCSLYIENIKKENESSVISYT